MDKLWAPWRMEYILSAKNDGCIFCSKLDEDDHKSCHILFKSKKSFVMLNKYPYNSGHLMVAPLKHVAMLDLLESDERSDLMDNVSVSIEKLKEALSPQGFNVGMNLGEIAGAGEPGHLHFHIVPRWAGDTNFMPMIGETKVIGEHLDQTYEKLLSYWSKDEK